MYTISIRKIWFILLKLKKLELAKILIYIMLIVNNEN